MLVPWLIPAIITAPAAFAGLCLALPRSLLRRLSVAAGAMVHLGLVALTWRYEMPFASTAYLGMDPLGHLFLTLISVLFLAVAVYFIGYHQRQLLSQRVFLACMLLLLASLSVVCMSQHLGVLWVALEASSLAATPLIYFHLGARSLEATWKFLLMNSVGIALALLGILSLAIAATADSLHCHLTMRMLVASATQLDPIWVRAAFLLAMIGFGTKMGLAPMHCWKPDAYGEAPPPVAALLAGGMTLGGFIGILRFLQVCNAAGHGAFAGMWMSIFGLLSIATAAVFVIRNNDYRRLLAYTSVEHMGVLVLGAGLAAGGPYASMLHAMHNTLNKGVLFLVAGVLWRIYSTNRASDIRGTVHRRPIVGVLLLLGLCATCGLPPFGMFFSEFGILAAAIRQSQWWVAGAFVVTLAMVFIAVMTAILPMIFGDASPEPASAPESLPGWRWRQPLMLIPPALLAVLALGLGVYQPAGVTDALNAAANTLGNPAAPIAQAHSIHPAVADASLIGQSASSNPKGATR